MIKLIISILLFPALSHSQISMPLYSKDSSKNILKDFMSFWKYYSEQINLSDDFIPVDSLMNIISKDEFLTQLSSGEYLPTRVIVNGSLYYKNFKITDSVDASINSTLKAIGELQHKYYLMEGNTFPDFNFVELNGRKLGNETILGKIVVLKCWFIKCQQCVEEIPYLNELVNSYKKRKDIEFISFALDDKPKLKEFLVKKKFSYTIIANQKDFIEDKLNIGMYPTHILVNKDGKIVKVVNNAIDMKLHLEKLLKN